MLAAQAGCDLLAFCKSHDAQVEAIEALVRACESGEVPFKEQEAAEGRVRALKQRFLAGYADPDPKQARRAAEDGATPRARGGDRRALRDPGLTWPASPGRSSPAT